MTNDSSGDDTRHGWTKALRRKINYAFRISISLVHYLLAYFEWASGDADSDDQSHSAYVSISGYSSTDDTTTYHNIRRQDKYYCLHATFLALSLLLEVAGSFLCKKNDRNVLGSSFSIRRQPSVSSNRNLVSREATNSSDDLDGLGVDKAIDDKL